MLREEFGVAKHHAPSPSNVANAVESLCQIVSANGWKCPVRRSLGIFSCPIDISIITR